MPPFPSIMYHTVACFLSSYGEYVRFFLPHGVFLPCGQGLDFRHSIIQSINRANISDMT